MDLRANAESYFDSSDDFLNRVHQIQFGDAAKSDHETEHETKDSVLVVVGGTKTAAKTKDESQDHQHPIRNRHPDVLHQPEAASQNTSNTSSGAAATRTKLIKAASAASGASRNTSSSTRAAATRTKIMQEPTFTCQSSVQLTNVTASQNKGLAIDDTTFSQCPSLGLTKWPNTDERLPSVRLFKAWDSRWDSNYDRKAIWRDLREYVWANSIKVLFGTQISCNETADDADWAYAKELMEYIGWYYTMGLAIGNEVELIHLHPDEPKECKLRLFQQKYFQRKVDARAKDMDKMEGFSSVPLTTVMGGYILSQKPFVNTPEAGVVDFFRYVNGKYGRRWVYTWNVYPYFEPNVHINPYDPVACGKVMYAAQSFEYDGMITTQLRQLRQGTQMITGRWDDVTWLGETGWSWPRADTLHTDMSKCPGFSDRENFLKYYKNFMLWDLSLGGGVHPINHVFYFTMRDAHNWDESEYFGMVQNCASTKCKLQ